MECLLWRPYCQWIHLRPRYFLVAFHSFFQINLILQILFGILQMLKFFGGTWKLLKSPAATRSLRERFIFNPRVPRGKLVMNRALSIYCNSPNQSMTAWNLPNDTANQLFDLKDLEILNFNWCCLLTNSFKLSYSFSSNAIYRRERVSKETRSKTSAYHRIASHCLGSNPTHRS